VPSGYFGSLCPEYGRMPDFEKDRYLGLWYEGFRDSRIRFEKGDCVTADYSEPGDKPEYIRVNNSEQRLCPKDKVTRLPRNRAVGNARANPNAAEGEAGLQVYFSRFQPVWGNYDILQTDYDNFSVIYSCQAYFSGLIRSEFAWILMRHPHLKGSPEFLDIEAKGKAIL